MLLKAATLGFAGLMILGATCEEQGHDPETIARCIDPRRIDFDHGVQRVCDSAQRIAHPIDTMSAAFNGRQFRNDGFAPAQFERPGFAEARFGG